MKVAPIHRAMPMAYSESGRAVSLIVDGMEMPGPADCVSIVRRLNNAPHHVLVRAEAGSFTRKWVEALLAMMERGQKLSFTRVQIDADAAAKPGRGTKYSRTNLPLTLHTDAAHTERPHSIVAFQMVRPDGSGGGESIVVPVADIVARLDPAMVAALREPRFDFGKGRFPIIWGPQARPSMRYYRAQIDARCTDGVAIRATDVNLLNELDALLAGLAQRHQFALQAGDLLLINNHKALHARTGFAADSDRLLWRYRLRVTALE